MRGTFQAVIVTVRGSWKCEESSGIKELGNMGQCKVRGSFTLRMALFTGEILRTIECTARES
jgi:hypothetical protein